MLYQNYVKYLQPLCYRNDYEQENGETMNHFTGQN